MKEEYRKAVFVVIYKIEKKKEGNRILYLLLRRRHHWKGWEFTKGGVDKGEGLREGALREAREESNLKPIKIIDFKVKGKYKYKKQFRDRPGYTGQTYHLFAAQVPLKNSNRVRVDKKEHSGWKWMNFDKAMKKLRHNNQKYCLAIVNKRLNKI